MSPLITRRSVLATATATAATAALSTVPAVFAQAKPKLRFSGVFAEQDIRADAFRMFRDLVKDHYDFEPHFNSTLFKQGTELVAIQRGNLEMGNIAPQDISKQIPSWSLLTAAYLFRDADHIKKTFASDVGREMNKLVKDQLGVVILAPTYFGTRQVNLKPTRKINTPADMAGIKLRMPPGEAWQLLGEAMGANVTPVAFAELYTALQSGAVDGQDNPLPGSKVNKFYEVTTQFVLTSHLVGYDVLAMSGKIWDAMTPADQKAFQAAVDKVVDWSTAKHIEQEKEAVDFFKAQGLQVYTPDVASFRANAQKKYLASDLAKDWPKGMLERINAVK
ncbi:MAG: TRAP transporter substrate-binding protein DctP [Proteobacteria bacterium]|nr:TRAP transporter substrate-binding protein DctP [Pseudomonadota bacterium]